jgi:polysaccharide biosynthesis protein PslG
MAVGLAALALGLGLGAGAAPAAAQVSNPYGMNIHAPTGSDLTAIMTRLQAAGMGWARVDMVWSNVEGTPGAYDWSLYDAIVAAAQAHDVQLMPILEATPAWATSGPAITGVPQTAAWTAFCTQAAARYAGSIEYWEIWNEPNLTQFWAGTRQQYIDELLIPGAAAIHAANPNAKVGGPALSHLGSADWYDWLNDVLMEAGGSLDFVTHHVYDTSGSAAVTAKLNGTTVFGGDPSLWGLVSPSVREVLENAHWFGKPFWLTESGWQSAPIGEARQATYYGGLLGDWFTGLLGQSWMNKVFFYEMEDPPGGASTWGILNADGSPKAAYGAYESFIASRGGPPPPPPPPPPAPPTDGAHLVAAEIPQTMDAGLAITVSVTFQNTGTSTWTAARQYKLGAIGGSDPFGAPRQLIPSGVAVAPGQQITFTIPFTAPAAAGVYTTHWQMLREGVDWFGDQLVQQVKVNVAPTVEQRTLALLGGRFAVSVGWYDSGSGEAGFGQAVPMTDETGTFWFFAAANTELVIKMLDARSVNQHFWFFYGALSDEEYWITVTDLVRGTEATYYNPPGNLCGQADTSTFGTVNANAAPGGAPAGAGSAGAVGLAAGTAEAAVKITGATAGPMGVARIAGTVGPAGMAPTVVRAGAMSADEAGLGPVGPWGRWLAIEAPAGTPRAGVAAAGSGAPTGAGAGASAGTSAGALAGAESAAAGCVSDATDVCLLAGRFQVSVTWQTTAGMAGSGGAAALSDETGTFAFFDPNAVDLVVKVLDGRALTGKFWFFYGALTNVEYTITLTDTVTGSSKQYHNAQGNLCGLGDTSALN